MTGNVRRVTYCPHCSNLAPQRLIHTQCYYERTWSSDGLEDQVPWSTFVAVCETCGHLLLYDNPGDTYVENMFASCELEYPRTGKLHKSIPQLVLKVYEEAFRIKSIAPNAFAVQIRRALETVCEDRGAEKGTLQQQLRDLTEKGEIPPVLSEASDALRLLGNVGAHGIHDSVHPLQAYAIDDFFRAIVEYIYVAPAKINDYKDRFKGYSKLKQEEEAQLADLADPTQTRSN